MVSFYRNRIKPAKGWYTHIKLCWMHSQFYWYNNQLLLFLYNHNVRVRTLRDLDNLIRKNTSSIVKNEVNAER